MGKMSTGGSGRTLSASQILLRNRAAGFALITPIDLNRATPAQLAAHPLIGKRLAASLVARRRRAPLLTALDVAQIARIGPHRLAALEAACHGTLPTRCMLTSIATLGKRCYVGEPFGVDIAWTPSPITAAELLVLEIRFASGERGRVVHKILPDESKSHKVRLHGFVSGEAGEVDIAATLYAADASAHRHFASVGVFTRNPVQMFITPGYWTQSGAAGAPKYHFGEDRWYCHADVRWVNGTGAPVNLGRRVSVRITDAGIGEISTLAFNLSGDIVVPAWTTVYGNLFTWHGAGNAAYDEYMAKGDLTYHYEMSGSGHTVRSSRVWRAMRTIGYNIIRVGDFTAAERAEYRRAAAEVASDILRSRDMTVFDAELYRIEGTREMDADKTRFRFIDSQSEINDLRSKYTVDNWFLDVFMVEGRWDGAFGSSPSGGPVDKQGASSGIVIRRDDDTVNLGQTFAHEAGHYLGLEHADEDDGCADTDPADANIDDNFIFSSSRRDSEVITGCQINKMRQHGLVRSMTP